MKTIVAVGIVFWTLLTAGNALAQSSAAPAAATAAAPATPAASASPPAAAAPKKKVQAAAPKPEPSIGDRVANFFRSNGNSAGGAAPAPAKPGPAQAKPAPAAPSANNAQGQSSKEYMANRALASYSTSANSLGFGFYKIVPKEEVAFKENYSPGTILVRQRERRLYYVLGQGKAIKYAIAVGKEGSSWSGTSTVSQKREWPDWTPTPAILQRQPDLPRHVEGGPGNPLGARALYLGATMYRIHGTNEPWRIGEEASSGCIRLTNDDIIDLYDRTRIGATVVVQH